MTAVRRPILATTQASGGGSNQSGAPWALQRIGGRDETHVHPSHTCGDRARGDSSRRDRKRQVLEGANRHRHRAGQRRSFRFVDNPPRAHRELFEGGRVSAGDAFAIFQPVRSTKGRRVGSLNAVCTAVQGGRNFDKAQFACHGGYRFKRGTLELEALFKPRSGVKIAITGGTGVYLGASGAVRSKSGNGRSVDTIRLLP